MCIVAADGRLIEANAAWRALGGGEVWSDIFHTVEHDAAAAVLARALRMGESSGQVFSAGSTFRPTRIELNITADLSQQIAYIIGRDITALSEKSEMTMQMINASPSIVWAIDNDGIVLFSEGGGLAKLGISSDSTLGMNAFEMYKDSPDTLEALREGLSGRSVQVRASMGNEKYLDTWYVPLLDPSGARLGLMGFSLDSTDTVRVETELRERLAVIQEQSEAISTLSALVLDVWEGVVAVPVVGKLDTKRAELLMERLLEAVRSRSARFAVLDLTGVDSVDTDTAEHLLKMCKAVSLLGTRALVSGVQPAVAQTLIALGIGMSEVRVVSTLRAALALCFELGKQQLRSKPLGR